MTNTRILTPRERGIIQKHLRGDALDAKEANILKLVRHDIRTNWKTINDDYLLIVKLDISTFKQQRASAVKNVTVIAPFDNHDDPEFNVKKAKKK